MPRKKYQPHPGTRPIGDARRYSVRSARRGQINQRKYVAAMARYAVAQAEKDAREYEAEAGDASNTGPQYKEVSND